MQPAVKVVVYWGDVLYDTVLCEPKSDVTVGRKPGSTFLMDIPEFDRSLNFPLLRVIDGKTAELQFTKFFDGHVKLGSGGTGAGNTGSLLSLGNAINRKQARTDGDGFFRLDFNAGDKAEVVLNHVTFHLDWMTDQAALPRGKFITTSNLISLIAFLLLVLPFVILVNSNLMPEKEEKPPERLVQILPKIEKPPEVKPIEKKPVEPPAEAAAGQKKTKDGGAEKGELGKADLVPPKNEKVKKAAVAKAPPNGPVTKAPVDTATTTAQTLRNANLSSVLKGIASLGTAEAPDAKPVKGAIEAPIAQEGTGGFSTAGLKKGGGGKSVGIGRTVGQGEGGFEGTGRLGLSGTTIGSKGTGRGREKTVVEGGLDREVIDNIIRQRKDRIRLCYERQLNFKPKLSGKLVVQFVIGKEGNVLQSDLIEDTMKDENVRGCLLAEVKSWTFPKPQGGTVVTVDYPFVFESGAR